MTVGLFPAVAGSLSSAHRVRSHAQIAEVMSTAVEAVQRASWKTNCDYAPDFTTALASVTIMPKPTITQVSVSKWDGNTFVGTTPADGCPTMGAPSVFQIVRLTIKVAASTGPSFQSLEVVKRL